MRPARTALAILGGALLLLWPAVLNGYPLVFIDTVSFLAQTVIPRMAWDKPWIYGPLLHLGHWQLSLWGAALLQACVLSWLLWLVQRVVLPPGPAGRHLLLMAAMAALTALPWFAAMLMPDVFAGAVVLTLWLLAFGRGRLSRAEALAILVLATLSIAMHLSHLPIAAAMAALALLLTRRPRPALRVAAPLGLALILLLVSNGIGHGRFAVSPYGATFALARLQADGPAVMLLRERCPEAGWYLCDFLDRLPMDSDEFLWDPASPVSRDAQGRQRRMGTVLLSGEAAEIVGATLAAHPWAVLGHALRNGRTQLLMPRVGDMLSADHLSESARMMIEAGFPARELAAFDAGEQMRGQFPAAAAPFLVPHMPVVLLSAVFAIALAWRGRRDPAGSLLAFVLAGLLANALATGALSMPHERYQARIIWLLPFAVAVAGLARWPRPASPELPAL